MGIGKLQGRLSPTAKALSLSPSLPLCLPSLPFLPLPLVISSPFQGRP